MTDKFKAISRQLLLVIMRLQLETMYPVLEVVQHP